MTKANNKTSKDIEIATKLNLQSIKDLLNRVKQT